MPASTAGIKISAKVDAQWSASQKWQNGKILGRPTKKSADRPNIWPKATKQWLVASIHGRWCVGVAHKPLAAPQKINISVCCKTKHKTVESRDLETRRVAETSRNSRWTQTRMITECSISDVQVLRTVKNRVSTVLTTKEVDLYLYTMGERGRASSHEGEQPMQPIISAKLLE